MSGAVSDNLGSARIERAAVWAARLADGGIPADQQADFQAWLDADPAHGTAIEEIVGAWDSVENYATTDAVMELRQAALASARRSLNHRPIGRSGPALRFALIAASLVAMLGAAAFWSLMPTTYQTGIGERRVIALADGSKVSLDADTIVKVRYTHKDRRLWLEQGRAKFDVAKNPLRPFSVEAANEIVVATGTAFSVEMLENHVHVVLYEGHVALLERSGRDVRPIVASGSSNQQIDHLLTPGREIVLADKGVASPAARQVTLEPADPVRSLSWEAGELVFNDEKLSTVVERVNRYSDKPIRIGDANAAYVRVSGVFQAGDTDALVQGLAAAFNVRSQEGPDAIILTKSTGNRSGG